jgi:hypothetical protein
MGKRLDDCTMSVAGCFTVDYENNVPDFQKKKKTKNPENIFSPLMHVKNRNQ